MSLLLQQLPALIGVVVGVLATYLTAAAHDRAVWRRTQGTRWDEVRMRAYAEYGDAVKRMNSLAVVLAVSRGIRHEVVPTGRSAEEDLIALGAASVERSARWEAVLLLGTRDTIAAARAWHECVWRLEWFARGKLNDQDEWETAVRDAERARDHFYACAREDLGVRGRVPPPNWPPSWASPRHQRGGALNGNAVEPQGG
jgi:hypothetical protein